VRKYRRSWKNHARRKSRLSGVQALESSQFMSTAKEMFPHGTAVPQHGAELRKTVRHLPERQKLPDLLHPRFPHQPRCRPQPLRASAGRQSAMQRLCRLRTVPSKVEIVSRYCSCGLHNLSIFPASGYWQGDIGKSSPHGPVRSHHAELQFCRVHLESGSPHTPSPVFLDPYRKCHHR